MRQPSICVSTAAFAKKEYSIQLLLSMIITVHARRTLVFECGYIISQKKFFNSLSAYFHLLSRMNYLISIVKIFKISGTRFNYYHFPFFHASIFTCFSVFTLISKWKKIEKLINRSCHRTKKHHTKLVFCSFTIWMKWKMGKKMHSRIYF